MWFFYKLAVVLYQILEPVLSLFSKKTKLRRGETERQNEALKSFSSGEKPVVWMHCASLGEFEQGRTVLEKIKEKYPDSRIVLSFFSPSGYDRMKEYEMADLVLYLPIDLPSKVRRFIARINPSLVLWVKYEFWWNALNILKQKNIPVLLISAVFRKGRYPLNFLGTAFLPILKGFDRIFVQDTDSMKILQTKGINHVEIIGDTRVDRVLKIAQEVHTLPRELLSFAENYKILICGSTWPEDERILHNLIKYELPTHWKVIIAPHNVHTSRIRQLQKTFPKSALWSDGDYCARRILIVDNIGWLSRLYRLGAVAYIGGGFKTGLHNILEPAAFGLPIVFGNKYKKFREAVDLVKAGGAFSVNSVSSFHTIMEALFDDNFRMQTSQKVLDYIQHQSGATSKLMSYIARHKFLNGG